MRTWPKGIIFLLGIVISFLSGMILAPRVSPRSKNFVSRPVMSQIRSNAPKGDGFQFINPLLGCEVQGPQRRYAAELKAKIEKVISEAKARGEVAGVSVYFDTRDGRWFGINTADLYYPASLLKVPLMMAYLKAAENDNSILGRKLVYTGEEPTNPQFFPPTKTLEKGKSYTTETLLDYMIKYSNNEAAGVLFKDLGNIGAVEDVFADLGVSSPLIQQSVADYMTVYSYARFFRVLYNASYLGRSMSEKALKLLSATNFFSGITEPISPSIMVAHKFGERTMPIATPKSRQELHDCGIVYHPKHDYLLCVMTKGETPEKLAEQIRAISKTVYEYMNDEFES